MSKKRVIIQCIVCKKQREVYPSWGYLKTCGISCGRKLAGQKLSIKYQGSGNPMFGKTTTKKQKDWASRLGKKRKGSKHLEQSKKKISLSQQGIPKPKVSIALQGIKLSEQHRKNIKENCLKGKNHPHWGGNYPLKGNLHPKWITDRSLLKKSEKKHLCYQYKVWMVGVKNRDNWVCKIFNKDCRGRLEAHHILNWVDYPELRYDIKNGITLCQAHHPRGRAKEKRLAPYFMELASVSSE